MSNDIEIEFAFKVLKTACLGDPLHMKALSVIKQEFVIMKSRLEHINDATKQLKKSFQEEVNVPDLQ